MSSMFTGNSTFPVHSEYNGSFPVHSDKKSPFPVHENTHPPKHNRGGTRCLWNEWTFPAQHDAPVSCQSQNKLSVKSGIKPT